MSDFLGKRCPNTFKNSLFENDPAFLVHITFLKEKGLIIKFKNKETKKFWMFAINIIIVRQRNSMSPVYQTLCAWKQLMGSHFQSLIIDGKLMASFKQKQQRFSTNGIMLLLNVLNTIHTILHILHFQYSTLQLNKIFI